MSSLAVPSENHVESSSEDSSHDSTISRPRYTVLQSLVGVMLAYQLLSGAELGASRPTIVVIVVGLVAMVLCLWYVPTSILQAAWFSGTVIGIDTVLVTATIYLSGNARSELYLSYFILMLIAASVRRLSHVIGLSLLLSTGYGVILYQGIVQTGSLSPGHLLGVPVLLVMATFYGLALQSIGTERQQKVLLQGSIEALKETERALQSSRDQLEVRIKGLKGDLSRANEHVRQEKKEREGLEQQLHDAQKMEAVGRIAGGIANELSHLVSVIGRQTGVVLSRLKPDDPLYGPVDDIFRSGGQAAAVTAQLAGLGFHDGHVRQVLSVKAVLEEIRGVMRGLLPASIDLCMVIEDAPMDVEVDREGFEQVLLQLAVNARDAMPNGGRLLIEAKQAFPVHESGSVNGRGGILPKVLIQVTDTGNGMNLETQSHMFEPFFSTKEMNVGLGLTAVYGIVKQSAGQVDVVSRPGEGTVVRVALPLIRQGRPPAPSILAHVAAKGQETVLLVEPNEIDRKLALSTLLRHRYHVLEASSSVEALLLTQRHPGAVHVAVSDLMMPEISGRDLAKRLLKHHPMMKPLFVSGYDDETMVSHRLNPRYLLRRPYRQTGLMEKVRELLDT
ncbi:MAG TPA: ATP-binding protein [Nitrospiraceae bacterium]|nr:ATP-binding protein [Nitrospiraceae bacterium]